MTANDLSTPLGMAESRPARRRLRLPLFLLSFGAAIAALAFFALWVALVDDPLGGEPVAIVAIDAAAPPQKPAAPAPAAGGEAAPAGQAVVAGPGRSSSAGEVEAQSGVTVVRGPGAEAPAAVIIKAPEAPSATAGLAPPDPALQEKGRQGALPKIGPDGTRPADAYARPVVVPPALKGAANPPRIAILVGGMGISQNGTSEAIAKLPAAVTLAFAPYGSDLDRVVQKARGAGHEVMLQAPMEPFDYPDNDPGPQTLLTSQAPAQNLDRLHWQMSRFAGYVGVTGYMGARFTATKDAIEPVLREIAARGLIFADDGSSPRSLVPTLAKPIGLPALAADLVIDQTPTPAAIDGALAKLEETARAKGRAFGVATGLPVSIAHISDWAATLEKRGVLLVPVSALAKP
jgi:polysaccharide deacetylase 2 family uncharacterized protein YibQ